jgi:hypothetical protein
LTPPLTVHLAVRNTFSHTIDSLLKMMVAWGGGAVALMAIIGFRARLAASVRGLAASVRGLAAFVRARREARRQRAPADDGYL